jgi:tetratricopeptide (TPR) repeat protein
LRSLAKDNADRVARHLVSAGRLLDSDPDAALRQAQAARSLAGRVGVVREAAGLAAYAAGQWQEAITELRAAARLGAEDHLAVMADSERGLGRPERALELGRSARAAALGPAERAELLIVLSGARRDLGQLEAAVVTLAGPDLDRRVVQPWTARLWYAYAEALLAAGRTDEAVDWFAATAGIDDGETDAEERVLSLTGVDIDEQPDAAD